jgi:hypothetical protein
MIRHLMGGYAKYSQDRRGRNRMLVGFSAIYAISAYHH